MVEVGDYILVDGLVFKAISQEIYNKLSQNTWEITENTNEVSINEKTDVEESEEYIYIQRFYDLRRINKTEVYDTPDQTAIDAYDAAMSTWTHEQSLTITSADDLLSYGISTQYFGSYISHFVEGGKVTIKTYDKEWKQSERAMLKYKDRFADWYESPWEDGGIYYVFTV